MADHPSLETTNGTSRFANVLSTTGLESIGWIHHFDGGINQTSLGVGAANRALYVPLYLTYPCVAKQLFAVTATASGNIDVGLYDYEGNRLVSSGSTAMSGSTLQLFDVTDTALTPGRYYLAVAIDNTTGTLGGARGNFSQVGVWRLAGVCMQESAFALPATATFATLSQAFCPWLGIQVGRML